MTDDLVKRLRELSPYVDNEDLAWEAADRIEELREYLYLTANTLQDFISFGDGINSPTWKDFCKEIIAHAKKLSRNS